jgi:hypothetical protein
MNNIVFLAFAILITASVGGYFSPSLAQVTSNTTVANTNLTETISTKYVGVTVLYESPHTVILSGEQESYFGSAGSLWEAVDLAKTFGYKIDAVAQVTEESSAIGNTRYLTPVYTIFFSK